MQIFGQSNLMPLKIEGRFVKTLSNNQNFQIKSVNLNDYMEHSYNPWGQTWYGQDFQTVLSWLHTSEDYVRIKAMGFNSVRLNICPSHFSVIPNLQRIKDHINWARQNNLYIIIGYFAPPGSVLSGGYYDESAFWLPSNTSYRTQFINDWKRLMDTCKVRGYRNVLYNILNEPQILYDTSYARKIILYRNILSSLLSYKINNNDSNLVIIDGPAYAQPDFRGFNYLNSVFGNSFNNQIIYDFHYYMFDFTWRRSLWTDAYYPYHNRYDYSQNNSGYDTINLNMNLNNWNPIDSVRIIKLQSLHQSGKYLLKYFEVKQGSTTLLAMDMTGQQILIDGNGKYILNNGKRWQVNYGVTPYGTAAQSNMYIQNGNSMVFSNTVRQDTGTSDIQWFNAYCELKYDRRWNNFLPHIHIPLNTPLSIKLVMDGDTLNENGSFQLTFQKDDSGPYDIVSQRIIQNYKNHNYKYHEKDTILTSHTDRVNAVFRTVRDMSVNFGKPFIIGEWAIPIQQRVSQNFSYFRDIWNNLKTPIDSSIGWSYHAYREPHENWKYPDSSMITISLFSGRNSTNASVTNIINGIQNGQTFDYLTSGNTNNYYYNKSLIDTLVGLMGGSFVTGLELINSTVPNVFALYQNYPNPFNPNTEIKFSIPKSNVLVQLILYDITGREIKRLVNQQLNAGNYLIKFDAENLSSGVYFYTFKADYYLESKKMVLIR